MINMNSCIKSLHLEDIKIYHVIKNDASVMTKGRLEVLYVPDFDRYILHLNNFKYALSKHLPVRGSIVEARSFRSYILPAIEGHYIIKLKVEPHPAVLANLETIFQHYSMFSYQSEQEAVLRQQMLGESGCVVTEQGLVAPVSSKVKAGRLFKKGGELLKHGLIKGAHGISRSIAVDSYVQSSNQLQYKTIEELRNFNSSDCERCSYPLVEIENIIQASDLIHPDQISSQGQLDAERATYVNKESGMDSWNGLKRTAGDSASSVKQGAEETFTIISNAFKLRKANKLTRKTHMQAINHPNVEGVVVKETVYYSPDGSIQKVVKQECYNQNSTYPAHTI